MYGADESRFLISSEKIRFSRLRQRKAWTMSRWLFMAKPTSFSDHQITPKFFKPAINYLLSFKTFSLFLLLFPTKVSPFLVSALSAKKSWKTTRNESRLCSSYSSQENCAFKKRCYPAVTKQQRLHASKINSTMRSFTRLTSRSVW